MPIKAEHVHAYGNINVQAVHPSTLMFTKESHLTKTGDCIVAVSADKAVADLSEDFKEALKKPNAKLTIAIQVNGEMEEVNAFGSPKLTLTHQTDMVIRKSNYVCNRTLAINANKAAKDLPPEFVKKLKDSKNKIHITLTIQS